jgi:hypothetical protein
MRRTGGPWHSGPVCADLDRAAANQAVAGHLASLDDQDIAALLDAATPGAPGIGGATNTFDIAGTRVFAKAVPLTDRELEHDTVGSTRNLFDLPTCYQYGIGSAGFGTWREIAVHERTTRWVLGGAFDGFPVVHHWRVLPRRPEPMPDRGSAVRRQIRATASTFMQVSGLQRPPDGENL